MVNCCWQDLHLYIPPLHDKRVSSYNVRLLSACLCVGHSQDRVSAKRSVVCDRKTHLESCSMTGTPLLNLSSDYLGMGVWIRWNGAVEWNGGMEYWNAPPILPRLFEELRNSGTYIDGAEDRIKYYITRMLSIFGERERPNYIAS